MLTLKNTKQSPAGRLESNDTSITIAIKNLNKNIVILVICYFILVTETLNYIKIKKV